MAGAGDEGKRVFVSEGAIAGSEAKRPRVEGNEAAAGFDLDDAHNKLQLLTDIIAAFSDVFKVHGMNEDSCPVVLHFSITKWSADFDDQLRELGLDEDAARRQVIATLTLGLARWVRTQQLSNAAYAFGGASGGRLLVQPYVEEGVRLCYFEDLNKTIDKIVATASDLKW